MKKQRKENLLKLYDEGIDVTDINFVTEAIKDYEEENKEEIPSEAKVALETEELIRTLTIDKKFSKMFELSLRVRPLGLKLKKIDEELSFRMGIASIFYDDEMGIYDYYSSKRNKTRDIRIEYMQAKRNKKSGKETELDSLRRHKIKLMRMKKNSQ